MATDPIPRRLPQSEAERIQVLAKSVAQSSDVGLTRFAKRLPEKVDRSVKLQTKVWIQNVEPEGAAVGDLWTPVSGG